VKALFLVIALALTGGLLAAACGGDNTSSTPTAASQSSATSSGSTANGAAVAVAKTSLGQVVTDTSGMTLYVFDKDTAGSGKSTCSGACATAWPPATTTNATPKAPSGLSGSLTTIKRDDGSLELTLDGRPLYRYAGDSAAGQTNGDGINGFGGLWHAAKASGAASAASPTAAASGGGGY